MSKLVIGNNFYEEQPLVDREWHILTPNPDADKEGVSYSGKHILTAVVYEEEYATLFAAAPDLLEACLSALYEIERLNTIPDGEVWAPSNDVFMELDAAIAKAKGNAG